MREAVSQVLRPETAACLHRRFSCFDIAVQRGAARMARDPNTQAGSGVGIMGLNAQSRPERAPGRGISFRQML